jgi:hypothetical protein
VSAALFILDASVLIDLCAVDRPVLRLISKHVGQLHVSAPMLAEELPGLTADDCRDLEIVVVEPELDVLVAAAVRRPGLSFHDHLCLLLAKTRTWTCLTNDGRLRRECKSMSVMCQWGLDPVVALVIGRHLDRGHAKALLAALKARSPGHYTDAIVAKFFTMIGG